MSKSRYNWPPGKKLKANVGQETPVPKKAPPEEKSTFVIKKGK